MPADQGCYTLITDDDADLNFSEQELRKQLESSRVEDKVEALKVAIQLLLNGEKLPSLLVPVIRYVMPCDDHTVKKLLLIFWEVVPKYGSDGKLLHEMILVCDAYRKDLMHPNEYVRGSTLRFLCKLKEPELLEPLMPTIQECLTNRHAYVRRNAVLAIYTIYKNYDHLIPDAPELIHRYLEQEENPSCKRNAFMMLITADQSRALEYLSSCIDSVQTFNEILQLVIVELVHKVCRTEPRQRSRFIRCIYNLLNSESAAVRYDAAGALLTLSSAPTAVTAAAKAYIELIVKEADNNVKLIVLDRLIALKSTPSNERVLQDMIMDILRVLAAPDLHVRKKTLALVLDLVASRNVSEVVGFIKKELARATSHDNYEKAGEYRQQLVRTLHTLGVRFPEAAHDIVPQLMEALTDDTAQGAASAEDVALFVREAFERLPGLHSDMMNKLISTFTDIKSPRVIRSILWIIGEYATKQSTIEDAFRCIFSAIGTLPIVDSELKAAAEAEAEEEADGGAPKVVTRTRITADGTYATESVYTSTNKKREERPALRQAMMDGDFFVASAVAAALTKLALRHSRLDNVPVSERHQVKARAMFAMASMLHLGKSGLAAENMTPDARDRIMACLRVLASPSAALEASFLEQCHAAFSKMLEATSTTTGPKKEEKREIQSHVDEGISFLALRTGNQDETSMDDVEMSISKATGAGEKAKAGSKLNKVYQLSGFSDPVYVEAYVNVNQYDILLDVLVVNQTPDTLQNLSLELATLGDLKLTEKPQSHTLGAYDFCNIRANVKVSSTETGIIFGNIVYDVSGATSDRNCVILNDIHIDILDYIKAAQCTDVEFRNMWAEFEWENKVAVRTTIPTLRGYLEHVQKTTNMRCLTPASALAGECDFLAANLYARSVFGEDALANLSIEKLPDGTVTGHIRIRSKTQGIALSLGDKITLNQKEQS
ncbi:uncharacterized protein MONBRDRAFT_38413 [Monosiga brevicollis MX1]|uniref:Coatomer subunit beta n=1 Tax=Monosiga brevicollis TaxID=81824 RepID=A9V7K9_MONBE|nr:uncharacterized protein MONBRDRAFT_38413 [Monosiga brevicollis MX1]EDQ86533.1 predicted protein [Monosiga brevicollis MX1]|eukprot:XP_001748646.1 hypothetical protein [Monosiga brevicollis MX1]